MTARFYYCPACGSERLGVELVLDTAQNPPTRTYRLYCLACDHLGPRADTSRGAFDLFWVEITALECLHRTDQKVERIPLKE